MADLKFSTKRLQIDKANANMVMAVGIAAFVIVSSLIFCKALLAQRSYQSKVIKAQDKAVKQLQTNIDNVTTLKAQYQAFVEQPQNIIGGSSTGTGDHDGDNAKIVLDALPSKYDFPALASSLDKLLTNSGVKITTINGTDDEIAQLKNSTDQSVDIPFTLTVSGSYSSVNNFVQLLEKSIRPLRVKTINFSGKDSELSASVTGITYYRPAKTLNVKQEVVKP